jgi:hypothetical protein
MTSLRAKYQVGVLPALWETYLFAFGFTPLEPFDRHTAGLVVDARHDRRVDSSCNKRHGSSGYWHHTQHTVQPRLSTRVPQGFDGMNDYAK